MILNYKCKICEKSYVSNKSLITHINSFHKMLGKDYYDCYSECLSICKRIIEGDYEIC